MIMKLKFILGTKKEKKCLLSRIGLRMGRRFYIWICILYIFLKFLKLLFFFLFNIFFLVVYIIFFLKINIKKK